MDDATLTRTLAFIINNQAAILLVLGDLANQGGDYPHTEDRCVARAERCVEYTHALEHPDANPVQS